MTDRKTQMRGGAEVRSMEAEPLADLPDAEPEQSIPAAEDEPIVTLEKDGTAVIRLTKALKAHKGKGEDPLADMTHIRIRPMFAGDMIVMDSAEGDITKVISLAIRLSGMPTTAIERLHADDFARVHGVIQGRLGKFLGTSRPLWALSLA